MGTMRIWRFLLAIAAKARDIIVNTISASGHGVEVGTPNLSGTVARLSEGVKGRAVPGCAHELTARERASFRAIR